MDDDILMKILVVGDVAVGKTSIIQRYANDTFRNDYKTTIGVEFALKPIEVGEKTINVQLWDIAGQDRFIGLLRNFYRNASGAIVVFDVSQPKTLENAIKWKADIDKKVLLPGGENIPCILAGNKADIRDTDEGYNCVDPDAPKKVAKEYGFLGAIETSAKTGANIERACKGLVKQVLARLKSQKAAKQEQEDTVKLDRKANKPKDGCC